MASGTPRVVVHCDLYPRWSGEPMPLAAPFGPHPTLLQATIARLVAMHIAPITVVYNDQPENARVCAMLVGEQSVAIAAVEAASPAAAILRVLGEGEIAVVVDARAAFASAGVLRAQIEAQARTGKDVCLASVAARGLSAIVATRAGLERLDALFLAEARTDPMVELPSFVDRARAALDVADAEIDERYVCMPVSLLPLGAADAAALAPHALPPGSDDYDAVFERLARAEWERWPVPPRRPARERPQKKILFTHINTSRETGATRAFELILHHWDRRRWDVTVALPCPGPLHDALSPLFPTHLLPLRWMASPTCAPRRPTSCSSPAPRPPSPSPPTSSASRR